MEGRHFDVWHLKGTSGWSDVSVGNAHDGIDL